MAPFTIRTATTTDAPRIALIHVETWQHAYRGQVPDAYLDGLPRTLAKRTEKWRETLAKTDRGLHVIVAEAHNDIVGFCVVNATRDDDHDARTTGELGAIYVDAQRMNQGAGTALHDAGLAALRADGFTQATLWVLESNTTARAWYEKRGWTLEGTKKIDDRGGVRLEEIRYGLHLSHHKNERGEPRP